MSKVTAYILRLTEKRHDAFIDNLSEYGNFAEAVDEFNHVRYRPLIVLIVTPTGLLSHIGQGRRGNMAGTGQRRLNIENLKPLSSPVNLTDVLDALQPKFRQHAERYFREGGMLPDKTSSAVMKVISSLAPETAEMLSLYGEQRRRRLSHLTSKERKSLAYQKDTVATALNIAGMDRSSLSFWTPVSDRKPKSFLEGLTSTHLREDQMIDKDMSSVPGYNSLGKLPNQANAVFENDNGETLTVIIANREPLEEQTGADLIYFNERYRAFIFVQYKAMESEYGKVVFRYPKEQLTKEVNRMESMLLQLQKVEQNNTRDGYRLNDNPFFLKFCPRLQFDPDSTSLVRGMYLPLGYWKSTADDPVMEGPKGGRHISYENAGRYFDNTSFANIVSQAWVGTTMPQSDILEDYIRQVTVTGRSVTFAVKREQDFEMA